MTRILSAHQQLMLNSNLLFYILKTSELQYPSFVYFNLIFNRRSCINIGKFSTFCRVVGYSYKETVYLINTSHNKTLEINKIAGGKCSQFQIATFGNEVSTYYPIKWFSLCLNFTLIF